jgi:DNA-binding GntR family transcriptional regulator
MAKQSGLIREKIYERVRSEILSCEIKPAAKIYEQTLADRFDVSKSPVRDALQRLVEQQLVDVIPRKGYRVRPISVADVLELYDMRVLLESACLKRAIKNASDDQLESLDRFRHKADFQDHATWLEYNKGFHIEIAEISGNKRLARTCSDVIEQFDRLTVISVNQLGTEISYRKFVNEHCKIIDAIQDRDRTRANRLLTSHIYQARKRTMSAMESMQIVA